MSQKLIVANWKANKNTREVSQWISDFTATKRRENHQYVVCPPHAHLARVAQGSGDGLYAVGAQDISRFEAGPYTGEMPGYILEDLGAQYCLIGHSERRRYFGETSALVAQKVQIALSHNIIPVVCIDKEEIQAQADQIDRSLYSQIIVAYEPVHAISTFGGQEDPLEVTQKVVSQIHSAFTSELRVLYGGSVSNENILTYIQEESLSGVLVGKTSLDPVAFARL